ncbi:MULTISPECIES: histidine phosphatase family protein [Mycobacterium]|uniref:Histidine phosphatase family protein n=1 Tax=Mycobacterium colombiense TaxID=339268 RepID=A0A329M7P5_9MYCO|nr:MULTISPECIES: histidine phosphatase family protein [Mycobacterium]MDM4138567.1 histidine phosphatase family protein [Mycobacterium sp. FLAC0960]RAV16014.1 histidine phosphatase family protein [Mycobacterium colombiense]
MLKRQLRRVGAVWLSIVLACSGSATASADESIVIDLVRHGQSTANAASLIDTAPPGASLTALGQQQAQAVAGVLAANGPVAAIFASQLIRTQQTAAPLASALGMNVQALPGLNEIDAGAFNGQPQISLGGLAYLLAPVAWLLGLRIVPMLAPGSTDSNGFEFRRRFNGALQTVYGNAATNAGGFGDALQTMYTSAVANPVRAANGRITEVAFSSEFAIGVGTMMSVKNPDPLLLLFDPLPNTGIVVIEGSPHDGWTLISWNGKPVHAGWSGARSARGANGLCLMLDASSRTGVCATKPPASASAPVGASPGLS